MALSVLDEALTILMKNGGEGTLDPQKIIKRLSDQKSSNCTICVGDINILFTGSSEQVFMRSNRQYQKDTLPDNFMVISTHEGRVFRFFYLEKINFWKLKFLIKTQLR